MKFSILCRAGLLLAVVTAPPACGFAQSPQVDNTSAVAESGPSTADHVGKKNSPANADEEEAERVRRRTSAVAGLLVLGLLCGVFLFLILVVVFWARRIRLETLEPLPEQHPGDPLWYLKKPPSTHSDQPDADEAESTL